MKLEELCEINMGQSPKSEYYNYDKYGLPFLQGNRTFGDKYPTFDVYTTSITKIAEAGDVIMSVRAPVGDINITPVRICLGRGVCSLRHKEGAQEFLYYLMRHCANDLRNCESGTVFGSVKRADIANLEINVPKLTEQIEIGRILGILDDKIANNAKINNHLEQMAQAIWSERFGGFEPNGTLGDIIELFDFKRVPLSGNQRDKMEKIYPYYGAATLMDYVDDYLFDGIYLLLGEDGTVIDDLGFPTLQYVWGKFWVNNHAHILQGRNGFTVESLYTLLKQTSVTSIVTGAVQPKINQANLKALPVAVPTADEMADFNALIEPLFAQIRANHDENLRLAKIRDVLLPKLMSGELSVADVDAK